MGLALVLLAACGGGQQAAATPAPSDSASATATGSPRPVPAPPNFNPRLGSNRVAAQASISVARALYKTSGYWEVYVRTEPTTLPGAIDPVDQETVKATARSVMSVNLIMATESGAALGKFRQGGHEHEKAATTAALQVLLDFFPVDSVLGQIYFGENDYHAQASLTRAGKIEYKVLDRL